MSIVIEMRLDCSTFEESVGALVVSRCFRVGRALIEGDRKLHGAAAIRESASTCGCTINARER